MSFETKRRSLILTLLIQVFCGQRLKRRRRVSWLTALEMLNSMARKVRLALVGTRKKMLGRKPLNVEGGA